MPAHWRPCEGYGKTLTAPSPPQQDTHCDGFSHRPDGSPFNGFARMPLEVHQHMYCHHVLLVVQRRKLPAKATRHSGSVYLGAGTQAIHQVQDATLSKYTKKALNSIPRGSNKIMYYNTDTLRM